MSNNKLPRSNPKVREPIDSEEKVRNLILAAVAPHRIVLLPNPSGVAYVGKVTHESAEFVTLENYRKIGYGLRKGASDFIGWVPRRVTQEDVGKVFAQFCALEVKNERGKPTPEQEHFVSVVRQAGGCAGVVRSAAEALVLCGQPLDFSVNLASIESAYDSLVGGD